MAGPNHEPEVIRAIATRLADELGAWLRRQGFSSDEVDGIARAAEIDALEYYLRS